MSKPICFDENEVALCPNGHGPMLMVTILELRKNMWPYGRAVVEARAYCLVCRHTMIVADERTPELAACAALLVT